MIQAASERVWMESLVPPTSRALSFFVSPFPAADATGRLFRSCAPARDDLAHACAARMYPLTVD